MMQTRIAIFTTFIFNFILPTESNAQFFPDSGYFRSPVNIPILLSGNFGELRSTHFHSGIDIKTQGKTGHNIYAAADGYVSRIKNTKRRVR